jgi:hypothetical protein
MWARATIDADGTAEFFGQRYAFVVLRENVLRIWPEPHEADQLTSVAEKRCEDWLRRQAQQESDAAAITRRPKSHWWHEAKKTFPGLSNRAFDRAWSKVAIAYPQISSPGRPKTTPD